jgi:hypothetical protein
MPNVGRVRPYERRQTVNENGGCIPPQNAIEGGRDHDLVTGLIFGSAARATGIARSTIGRGLKDDLDDLGGCPVWSDAPPAGGIR